MRFSERAIGLGICVAVAQAGVGLAVVGGVLDPLTESGSPPLSIDIQVLRDLTPVAPVPTAATPTTPTTAAIADLSTVLTDLSPRGFRAIPPAPPYGPLDVASYSSLMGSDPVELASFEGFRGFARIWGTEDRHVVAQIVVDFATEADAAAFAAASSRYARAVHGDTFAESPGVDGGYSFDASDGEALGREGRFRKGNRVYFVALITTGDVAPTVEELDALLVEQQAFAP